MFLFINIPHGLKIKGTENNPLEPLETTANYTPIDANSWIRSQRPEAGKRCQGSADNEPKITNKTAVFIHDNLLKKTRYISSRTLACRFREISSMN
jgi:hypothetical protein